jgi:hypothetical protein
VQIYESNAKNNEKHLSIRIILLKFADKNQSIYENCQDSTHTDTVSDHAKHEGSDAVKGSFQGTCRPPESKY